MSSIKSYKDLLIWQKGIQLVKEIYLICIDLPKDEVFGLQSQMKRAAISIPSNITEGYGRNYTQNYIQFIKIARGSLLELETQLIISKELDFINKKGRITEKEFNYYGRYSCINTWEIWKR